MGIALVVNVHSSVTFFLSTVDVYIQALKMDAARSDRLLARHQTREMGIRIEHAVTVLVVYTE
jgi:hypothetical protein